MCVANSSKIPNHNSFLLSNSAIAFSIKQHFEIRQFHVKEVKSSYLALCLAEQRAVAVKSMGDGIVRI